MKLNSKTLKQQLNLKGNPEILIQIDAGVGNTILYNGTASQAITLNTNGASVTLRKMTATQWMAI